MRLLDGITDSMDMNLSKLQEIVEDRGAQHAAVQEVTKTLTWLEVKSLSCVRLLATSWTIAYQAPLSVGFSRREYWSGLPFPSPGDLPDPGIESGSPTL